MSFDVTTHKRNPKGQIIKVDPYKLKISKGVKYFERPVKSGNWYLENGQEVDKKTALELSGKTGEK